MLHSGARGLGFAVGTEPLTSLFASMGCDVLATDLGRMDAAKGGWVNTNQNAASLDDLNERRLCMPEDFASRVGFRQVDMCAIPSDLRGFDFLWSSCAMEHLGSLGRGMDFVLNAMSCLRPGGIAVHTTEFNCDSDHRTVKSGGDVLYRRRDLQALANALLEQGYEMAALDFDVGDGEADRFVDEPPYRGKTHLKVRIGGFASTSFGLIIKSRE
jgi:2-polyprenyl-3-methyl-5-hydroxy-6-metoxy-1,4-benzoquinol methylase